MSSFVDISFVEIHRVSINEQNVFDRETIFIYQNDQIEFESSIQCENLCRTNEFGQSIDSNEILIRSRKDFSENFILTFRHSGIFYYSFNVDLHRREREEKTPICVVVLPEIRFHWKSIRSNDFDFDPIRTNLNDFIFWQFEQVIRSNMIPLRQNETLDDLISCHNRVSFSRNRQIIGLECIRTGTFFFANPGRLSTTFVSFSSRKHFLSLLEFERVVGSEEVRSANSTRIKTPTILRFRIV